MAEQSHALQIEIWKPVLGYEGRYEVSSFGRVRSLKLWIQRPDGTSFVHPASDRVLAQTTSRRGEKLIMVHKDGGRTTRRVSVLVCEAFHGPRPAGLYCLHGDGVRANNRPENLRWGTPQENLDDAVRHGVIASGENHPRAKLTDQQVWDLQADWKTGRYTLAQLGEKYGISRDYAWKLKGNRREATRLHHPRSPHARGLRHQGNTRLPAECGSSG